ncbi:hypothetical protein C882_4520 [Caenispirillum salinarum AK4]|uniref:Uncharacterized protein n=1 Tax=Caenispirillum salinarum AK4 TaxID=1238182 RepID=K9HQ49_9PROT|nr:hypothetical protein [Caenispirillum salinarum]EKV30561.1 hypothetical protein C882_4520 [Caenispirillum salinarum AK4]
MPAQIIDLTSVRLVRDLDAINARARHLRTLADRQLAACARAALGLAELRTGLHRFSDRLDHHRRRCEASAADLRRATDALESDDIDRMIEARDTLADRMGSRGHQACRQWPAVPRRRR